MAEKIFLLDASSYLFRAFYATPPLFNSKKIPTNATYAFSQMLLRLIKEYGAKRLIAVFDRPEPTFRKQSYAEYKAQRSEMPEHLTPQIEWIKKIVQALKIPLLEKPGFEADDIIGTLAQQAVKAGEQVVIVTSDKDLMQLVTERIELLDTLKQKWTRRAEVIERFGVPPEQVIEVLGLAGDSSDNIPGVPGIGEKTAAALIKQYHSIENLYKNLEELKGKRKEILALHQKEAMLSRDLATIHVNVPLEWSWKDFSEAVLESPELYEVYRELEFHRLIPADQKTEKNSSSAAHRSSYVLVNTPELLNKMCEELEGAEEFAFDTETTSLNTQIAELVGLSFATSKQAYYVPVGHVLKEGETQLFLQEVLNRLKPLLENPLKKKIAQNYKYDEQVLHRAGIRVQGLSFDTLIAAYLLEPAASHNLDALAQTYLDYKTLTFAEVTEGKKNPSFAEVSLEKALAYSAEDAEVTLRLAQLFKPKLKEQNLEKLFHEIELPLVSVLSDMEKAGIKTDKPFLEKLQENFGNGLKIAEEKIHQLAGESLNINSPKQLGKVLFEKLKLPVQRKTKTGYSTDVDVLNELSQFHELPKEILAYRSLAKLKSTYVDALLAIADPETHRVHTSFNQTIAETGRLSSSDPNLQNIPIRSEEGRKIREAFIAEKDFCLVSADYSQIELRILAHLAEEPSMIQAFLENQDIHSMTAASIFNLPESEVTPAMRAMGKTVNFGVIYGQTAFGLSQQLGIAPQKAKEYIEQYFARYPQVQIYRQKILQTAQETGEVRTLYQRRRSIPDILSKNPNMRAWAERTAFNTVIQGSAADIIKVAMIQIHDFLKKTKSRLLLQVHDELIFEVQSSELEKIKAKIIQVMEGVVSFRVPLKVGVGVGKNWGEAH